MISEGNTPIDATQSSSDSQKIVGVLLAALPLILIFVLYSEISAQRALWTDDLFSLTTAEESIANIFKLTASYKPGYFDHPPLYFIFLHAVLYLGNSPFILRLTSMIPMGLALGVWTIIMQRQKTPALLIAAFVMIMVTNPIIAMQSTTVRMYGLFSLITALALLNIFELEKSKDEKFPWKRVVTLGLLLAASVYTSYFGLFFCAATVLYAITGAIFANRPLPKWQFNPTTHIIAACFIALLFISPWLPVVFNLLSMEGESPPRMGSRTSQLILFLSNLNGGKIAYGGIAVMLAFVLKQGKDKIFHARLLVCYVAIPLAMLSILTPPDRVVLTRYLIFTIPIFGACVIAGAYAFGRFVMRNKSKSTHAAGIAALLISGLIIPTSFFIMRDNVFADDPDWWVVSKILESNASPDEIILTGGYLSGEAVVYHMNAPQEHSFMHYVTKMDPFYLAAKNPQVVWYVNSAPLPEGYEIIIEHYFPWRAVIEGNGALGPIVIAGKKPFPLYDGSDAPYHEPIVLEYEKR